jgi:hypothetical protein
MITIALQVLLNILIGKKQDIFLHVDQQVKQIAMIIQLSNIWPLL